MSMKPQIPVRTADSDDALSFIRQMGIEYVSLSLKPEELTYDCVMKQKERLAKFGLTVSDALCNELQKNKSIHLNFPDRDDQIRRFNDCSRFLERRRCHLHPLHGSPTESCAPTIGWAGIREGEFPLTVIRTRSWQGPTRRREAMRSRRYGRISSISWIG